jgi:hypothetical protein
VAEPSEPELTVPAPTHLCLACGKCFHRAFSCCDRGRCVWELRTLTERLAEHGLHLVSEADRRAIDAVVELAREVADLHDQGEHSPQLTERLAIAIAQLDGEDDG